MGWETHHPPPPFSPRGFWGAHGAGCGLGVLYPEQLWKSSRVALEGLGRLVPAAPGGWVGGGSKSTLPPPKKPSVGQCRVPGALQGPQPPGYPQPHGSHPMGQPQSPPPHPMTNPSPTAPTPWVSRAPQLPSHPVRSHLAPKGWRSRPPRTNLGAQPHAGSGQQCPAVVNPSTQGRSILPRQSGDLCLSFPRLQREGGWLGGVGQASPPGSSHHPASFTTRWQCCWGRNCGGVQRRLPGSTHRAQDRKKRGLFLVWFLRK